MTETVEGCVLSLCTILVLVFFKEMLTITKKINHFVISIPSIYEKLS